MRPYRSTVDIRRDRSRPPAAKARIRSAGAYLRRHGRRLGQPILAPERYGRGRPVGGSVGNDVVVAVAGQPVLGPFHLRTGPLFETGDTATRASRRHRQEPSPTNRHRRPVRPMGTPDEHRMGFDLRFGPIHLAEARNPRHDSLPVGRSTGRAAVNACPHPRSCPRERWFPSPGTTATHGTASCARSPHVWLRNRPPTTILALPKWNL